MLEVAKDLLSHRNGVGVSHRIEIFKGGHLKPNPKPLDLKRRNFPTKRQKNPTKRRFFFVEILVGLNELDFGHWPAYMRSLSACEPRNRVKN